MKLRFLQLAKTKAFAAAAAAAAASSASSSPWLLRVCRDLVVSTAEGTAGAAAACRHGALPRMCDPHRPRCVQGFSCAILIRSPKSPMYVMQRLYSASSTDDKGTEFIEEKSELMKKVGWLIKILAAVTITYVSFNMYPIMGDSLIWQSVALVRLDDPFMKRSGASRIALIATNDRRRKGFVEAGGITELMKMLKSASDEKTQLEAVKALVALCECDVAVEALHATGAEGWLQSFSGGSSPTSELEKQTSFLLQKLEDRKVKLLK